MTERTLTTRFIADFAFQASQRFAHAVGLEHTILIQSEELDHWEAVARKVLLEAANPNPLMKMAQEHDEEVAKKLQAGWRYAASIDPSEKTHSELLPFSQLPEPVKARAAYFRLSVVSFHPFWAGPNS